MATLPPAKVVAVLVHQEQYLGSEYSFRAMSSLREPMAAGEFRVTWQSSL